jgi:hypothetical protein
VGLLSFEARRFSMRPQPMKRAIVKMPQPVWSPSKSSILRLKANAIQSD